MRKGWLVFLLLAILLAQCACAGAAQDASLAAQAARQAREDGLALTTRTSFKWGGLPLLTEQDNKLLTSLLDALTLEATAQGASGSGYNAASVLLQKTPVLDLTMQAVDGVYYESSNLLGGQTVAFTAEEFRQFVARLSARADGAIPTNLDLLFEAVLRGLGGEALPIDSETYTQALTLLSDWEASALAPEERLRPEVRLPGRYGVREIAIDITRDELLLLAQAYSALLSENEALWRNAAAAQLYADADARTLEETAQRIADVLRNLPVLLDMWLPQDMGPLTLREIYGPDDMLVSRSIVAEQLSDARLYLEWEPRADGGIPELYLHARLGEASLLLQVTPEVGTPKQVGRETHTRNRLIAQLALTDLGTRVDITMTRTQTIQTQRNERETRTTTTDFLIHSDALLGEGTLVTLSAQTTETASGEGASFVRNAETVWRLKGLGFDGRKILSVTSRTTAAQAQTPPAISPDAVHPAQMSDLELNAWLAGNEISLMQAWYTILGKLPPDVAAYLLAWMQ